MGLRILACHDGLCEAVLDGEMTVYAAAALKEEIGRGLADCGEMEIDLAGVVDIDTAGLQLMLMAKRAGKPVRFVNHSRAVLDLLEFSNLAGAIGDPLLLPADHRGRQ